jgi:hypothetical protein
MFLIYSHHIVIAGTGRAGTSVLVELLDACGLDTNRSKLDYFAGARAGLEADLGSSSAPQVVKAPYLSEDLESLIAGGFDPRRIDVIIIPVRDLNDAAASRLERFASSGLDAAGGLWHQKRPSRQSEVLARAVHQLLSTAARHGIAVVLIDFPGFVTDADKAWAALGPVLAGHVTAEQFRQRHAKVMRPGHVHEQRRYGALALARLDARWLRMRATRRLRRPAGQVKRAIASKLSMARRV